MRPSRRDGAAGRLLGVALLALCAAAPPPQTIAAPESFTATYRVYARGLPVGSGTIALALDADGGYRMRSALAPSGLAALLVSDRVAETASGRLLDRGPRPRRYRYRQTGGERERFAALDFDWRAGTVASLHDGEARTLPLTPRAVDPLSVYLQVMSDLEAGRQVDRFTLIHRNERRDYRVSADGTETLDTPLGPLATRRFTRQRAGSRRRTRFWLAPALGHLPVRIAQYQDDSEDLRMSIVDVER